MKKKTTEHSKELYKAFRKMSFDRLWTVEREAFEKATDSDRQAKVVLVRALTAGAQEDSKRREMLRSWVLGLLRDDSEKVRRYAVNALPKLRSGDAEESALLGLLERSKSQRERQCVLEALGKFVGEATLGVIDKFGEQAASTKQRVLAGLARRTGEGRLDFDTFFQNEEMLNRLIIHLCCRKGLEQMLREELERDANEDRWFCLRNSKPGLLVLSVRRPFSLRQILNWRCWQSVGFLLGNARGWENCGGYQEIAQLVASELASVIGRSFTRGIARYRLELVGRGARRGFVKDVVDCASVSGALLMNDTRQAIWSVDVYPAEQGGGVELRPRLVPDPRFSYRVADVPAASHPPLASAMARLVRPKTGDVVWDPFCGSGVELVECFFLAGDALFVGTDVSRSALEAARKNLLVAGVSLENTRLFETDFRDSLDLPIFAKGVDVIVTNPPMGRRVPVGKLGRLIGNLFSVVLSLLKDGGRFALVNPLKNYAVPPSLSLIRRNQVDMGGFDGWLELYTKPKRKS